MFKFSKLSRKRQMTFIQLWAKLKKAGMNDRAILEILSEDYQRIYGSCAEVNFCHHALEQLRSWSGGFSAAMVGWFDNDITITIQSIKESNQIKDAVDKLFSQLTTWQELKHKIAGVLVRSAFLQAFALLIFIGVSFAAVSLVDQTSANSAQGGKAVKYTTTIQFLLWVNQFVKDWYWLALLLAVFLVVSWAWTLFFYVGENRPFMDKYFPFFGLYSANESSRFFSILSVTTVSGNLSLRDALEGLRDSGLCSIYILEHINEMLYRLQHQRISSSEDSPMSIDKIDTGLLPDILRLELTTMQRQSNAVDKKQIMEVISSSLVNDFGAAIFKRIERGSKVAKYVSLGIVGVSAGGFLDFAFSSVTAVSGAGY